MSLLIGHVVLGSAWKQAVLTLATLPLVIVKNGIRIVTLSLLSIYVDPSFLTGSLHRQGGIVFFLIALVLLVPILWLLQTSERADPMLSLPPRTGAAPLRIPPSPAIGRDDTE
jgi:exosortase/archaeosortase family protein